MVIMSFHSQKIYLNFFLVIALASQDGQGRVSTYRRSCTINNKCNGGVNNTSMESSCPVWFVCNQSFKCQCNSLKLKYEEVNCSERLQTASVIDCWCVTYDNELNLVVAGSCLANCGSLQKAVYRKLTQNVSKLNQFECGHWNRDGALCGKCRENFYPQVYSYNISCISSGQCKGYGHWWQYILAAYGPLTVFYLIIFACKINLTSSYLHAYVVLCQIFTERYFLIITAANLVNKHEILGANILIPFYSMWNLDFFNVNSGLCLKLDSLMVAALDYLIALYPLILTTISYMLMSCYDRNVSNIAALCKPIKCLTSIAKSNRDIHTSVMDAYATFFLLSYSKLLNTSMILLIPTTLYTANTNETRLVLFYDGTKEYFKGEHLPYGIAATTIFITCNVLPILFLLLYQHRCCQVIVRHLPVGQLPLKSTMDILQGCYKDGTEPRTRDMRWFSAVYFIFRMMINLFYVLTFNGMAFVYFAMFSIGFVNLLLFLQPYKKKYSNYMLVDSVTILLVGVFLTAWQGFNISDLVEESDESTYFLCVVVIVTLLPLVFITFYTSIWLLNCFVKKCKQVG